MSHGAYAKRLLALVLGACAALAALSWTHEPLSGDLTRVAKYSENAYGWNAPQKRFPKPLFDEDLYDKPYDVVVLGDSFSYDPDTGWQNWLAAATGASIATFHHGRTTLDEVLARPAYKAAPPKVFVYEIVERSLRDKLGTGPASCGGGGPAPRVRLNIRADAPALEERARPRGKAFAEINLQYALDFLWTNALRRLTGRVGGGLALSLTRTLFSSRRGDAVLVFSDDLKKKGWTARDLEAANCSLLAMQDRVQRGGRTLFLALVVPDKLSAYSPYLSEPRWAGLSVMDRLDFARLNAPRADRALAAAIAAGTPDVYLPDDTHLGWAGHAAVARAVLDFLRARR